MSEITSSDAFSTSPYYYSPTLGLHGESIASIIARKKIQTLNTVGIKQYLNKYSDGKQTCFNDIFQLPAKCSLHNIHGKLSVQKNTKTALTSNNVKDLIINALTASIDKHPHCALALSGGLDSALILALLKEISVDIEVFTLATHIPGYCELQQTLRTAKHFGVKLHIVEAQPKDFISALPEAIRSTETPIYNLHPVSKLLLAKKIKAQGYACLITGDAADQAFSGVPAENYIPLVGSIVRNQHLAYESPFFDQQVAAYGASVVDDNKSVLRRVSDGLLPNFITLQKKQPRLAPDFDINCHVDIKEINRLSKSLGIAANLQSESSKTLWTTLQMLTAYMKEQTICVA